MHASTRRRATPGVRDGCARGRPSHESEQGYRLKSVCSSLDAWRRATRNLAPLGCAQTAPGPCGRRDGAARPAWGAQRRSAAIWGRSGALCGWERQDPAGQPGRRLRRGPVGCSAWQRIAPDSWVRAPKLPACSLGGELPKTPETIRRGDTETRCPDRDHGPRQGAGRSAPDRRSSLRGDAHRGDPLSSGADCICAAPGDQGPVTRADVDSGSVAHAEIAGSKRTLATK